MPGSLDRLTRRFNAEPVSPARAVQLIRSNSGESDEDLDFQINVTVEKIVPPDYPSYKRKKLEKSLRVVAGKYGIDVLSGLNAGDINSRGEISDLTLRDLSRRK